VDSFESSWTDEEVEASKRAFIKRMSQATQSSLGAQSPPPPSPVASSASSSSSSSGPQSSLSLYNASLSPSTSNGSPEMINTVRALNFTIQSGFSLLGEAIGDICSILKAKTPKPTPRALDTASDVLNMQLAEDYNSSSKREQQKRSALSLESVNSSSVGSAKLFAEGRQVIKAREAKAAKATKGKKAITNDGSVDGDERSVSASDSSDGEEYKSSSSKKVKLAKPAAAPKASFKAAAKQVRKSLASVNALSAPPAAAAPVLLDAAVPSKENVGTLAMDDAEE